MVLNGKFGKLEKIQKSRLQITSFAARSIGSSRGKEQGGNKVCIAQLLENCIKIVGRLVGQEHAKFFYKRNEHFRRYHNAKRLLPDYSENMATSVMHRESGWQTSKPPSENVTSGAPQAFKYGDSYYEASLTLEYVKPEQSGNYTCGPSNTKTASVRLHITQGWKTTLFKGDITTFVFLFRRNSGSHVRQYRKWKREWKRSEQSASSDWKIPCVVHILAGLDLVNNARDDR